MTRISYGICLLGVLLAGVAIGMSISTYLGKDRPPEPHVAAAEEPFHSVLDARRDRGGIDGKWINIRGQVYTDEGGTNWLLDETQSPGDLGLIRIPRGWLGDFVPGTVTRFVVIRGKYAALGPDVGHDLLSPIEWIKPGESSEPGLPALPLPGE